MNTELCLDKNLNKPKWMKKIKKKIRINANYKCEVCDSDFFFKTELVKHLNAVHAILPYKCKICGKAFKLRDHLYKHKSIHDVKKTFSCVACERIFATLESLRNHERYDHDKHPKKRYPCELCGKTYCKKYLIHLHKLRFHSATEELNLVNRKKFSRQKRVTCDLCGKEISPGNLPRHRYIAHFKKRTVKRPSIERNADKKQKSSKLKKEVAKECTYASDDEYETDLPPPFDDKSDSLNIKNEDLKVSNKSINYQSASVEMASHYEGQDNDIVDENVSKLLEKRKINETYKCSCGKGFRRLSEFNRHTGVNKEYLPHFCRHCYAAFGCPGNLLTHKLTVHGVPPPCQCKICFRPFLGPGSLRRHLPVHNSDSHVCELCGKMFCHALIPNEPRRCIECQKNQPYVTEKLLEVDETTLDPGGKSVSGNHPRLCEICGKEFLLVEDLRKHIFKHKKEAKPVTKKRCTYIENTINIESKSLKSIQSELSMNCSHILSSMCKTFRSPDKISKDAEGFIEKEQIMIHKMSLDKSACSDVLDSNESAVNTLLHTNYPQQYDQYFYKNEKDNRNEKYFSSNLNHNATIERENSTPDSAKSDIGYVSDNTNYEFESDDLSKSAKIIKTNLCQYCGQSFRKVNELQTHIKEHKNEQPFLCHKCGLEFESNLQLKNHSNCHHNPKMPSNKLKSKDKFSLIDNIDPIMAFNTTNDNVSSNMLPCDFHKCTCGKEFRRKSDLNRHTGIHLDKLPHKCNQCNATFGCAGNLLNHKQAVHNEIPPYQCHICGMPCQGPKILKNHLLQHSKIIVAKPKKPPKKPQPKVCKLCGKTFYKALYAKYHMATHTKERIFRCEECDMVFYNRLSYRRHERRWHELNIIRKRNTRPRAIARRERLNKVKRKTGRPRKYPAPAVVDAENPPSKKSTKSNLSQYHIKIQKETTINKEKDIIKKEAIIVVEDISKQNVQFYEKNPMVILKQEDEIKQEVDF